MKKYVFTDVSQRLYEQADAEDIALAKKIYKKCIKSKNKVEKFKCKHPKTLVTVIMSLYFRYDHAYNMQWYSVTNLYVEKQITVNVAKFNKLDVRNKQILAEIKRIANYLGLKSKPKREAIQAIHDNLCESVNPLTNANGWAIYDVLFNHVGVCCGYADVFKALCDYIDIPCDCVANSEHEWNRVFIDNQMLYVDCIWDDSGNNKKYFLKTAKEMDAIHPKYTYVCDRWEVKR